MSTDQTLILRCLPAPVLRLPISRRLAVLGRSSNCECVVDDPSISRRHAEVRANNGELQVVDLNSSNGTFLAAKRVQTCQVKPGQVIRFGTVDFKLEVFDPSADLETEDARHANGKPRRKHTAEKKLTEAQQRVLELILMGLSEKGIAKRIHRSGHTVHTHIRAILQAFEVHSKLELIVKITQEAG
jgi:pSer/pThr/pTyr-binding forkhead associated (FHA) protein